MPGADKLRPYDSTMGPRALENGADIRFIQQLLGHERLDTTQIYTEVSIAQLREVHARCHPHGRWAQTATADLPSAPNAPSLPA